MSLDVYLTIPGEKIKSGSGIFVRSHGQTREVSREEWDKAFPGCEPVVAVQEEETEEVFHANITHNLARMASAASDELYLVCWKPHEIGVTKARDLINPLRGGLAILHSDPDGFKKLNPENGWGSYEILCQFVLNYMVACSQWPDAKIGVSR